MFDIVFFDNFGSDEYKSCTIGTVRITIIMYRDRFAVVGNANKKTVKVYAYYIDVVIIYIYLVEVLASLYMNLCILYT